MITNTPNISSFQGLKEIKNKFLAPTAVATALMLGACGGGNEGSINPGQPNADTFQPNTAQPEVVLNQQTPQQQLSSEQVQQAIAQTQFVGEAQPIDVAQGKDFLVTNLQPYAQSNFITQYFMDQINQGNKEIQAFQYGIDLPSSVDNADYQTKNLVAQGKADELMLQLRQQVNPQGQEVVTFPIINETPAQGDMLIFAVVGPLSQETLQQITNEARQEQAAIQQAQQTYQQAEQLASQVQVPQLQQVDTMQAIQLAESSNSQVLQQEVFATPFQQVKQNPQSVTAYQVSVPSPNSGSQEVDTAAIRIALDQSASQQLNIENTADGSTIVIDTGIQNGNHSFIILRSNDSNGIFPAG